MSFTDLIKGFYYRHWVEFHAIRRWEWSVIFRFIKAGDKVLDSGCGNGAFARKLANRQAKVYAFDYSPKFIEVAKKYNNPCQAIEYSVRNAEKNGYPNDFFDTTLLVSVIGQCDKDKALAEALRVTKKGGVVIVTSMTRNIADLTYVKQGLPHVKYHSIKSSFMKTIFSFFSKYIDWRFLASIIFYPFFILDSLLPGVGRSCVMVIKKT